MNHSEICENKQLLSAPNRDGNVWPHQCCPAFTPRGGAVMTECWFCVYADFHLEKPRALDVGVCCYPKNQTGGNETK